MANNTAPFSVGPQAAFENWYWGRKFAPSQPDITNWADAAADEAPFPAVELPQFISPGMVPSVAAVFPAALLTEILISPDIVPSSAAVFSATLTMESTSSSNVTWLDIDYNPQAPYITGRWAEASDGIFVDLRGKPV